MLYYHNALNKGLVPIWFSELQGESVFKGGRLFEGGGACIIASILQVIHKYKV